MFTVFFGSIFPDAETMASRSRARMVSVVTVVPLLVTVALLLPAYRERLAYFREDTLYIQQTRAAFAEAPREARFKLLAQALTNLLDNALKYGARDGQTPGIGLSGTLEGDKVVITEDTVTRRTSIFEAVDVVREFGAEVVLITVIVDRGGTCADMARAAGIPYAPLLTAPDLGFEFGS